MIVKEIAYGIFVPWLGSPEIPLSAEFTMTKEELAAHGLYVPIMEDTLPPSHFHEMGEILVIRDENTDVRRVINWIPIVDLETAREIISMEFEFEVSDIEELSVAQETRIAEIRERIGKADTLETLISIDTKIPEPEQKVRIFEPTKVETI